MSCLSSSSKISQVAARLAAGISALTSQRAFFAGLALAGAGTTVAGLLATLRRTRAKGEPSPRLVDVRSVPQLTPRSAVSPVRPGENSRCAECGSGDKDGPWYRLEGRLYCRDCARGVAKTLDVDLTLTPEPAPTPNGSSGPAVTLLSPERRRSTRLLPSRVRVRLGDSAQGPGFGIVENGWVVVDQRGFDTGLAVTPTLKTEADGAVAEEPGRWRLTHIDSGKALDGVYGSPEEAQAVAGVLAQIDWTKPERELTEAEINRAQATIRAYRQAVREVGSASGQPESPPKPASSAATRPPTDLTGQLIADRYGGLARVLADSGQTLLACDSLGQRYEVARREVRSPSPQDFELNRVAQPFQPNEAVTCSRCGRGSSQGEPWQKMAGRSFCPACAPDVAADEAYALADEIGDPL